MGDFNPLKISIIILIIVFYALINKSFESMKYVVLFLGCYMFFTLLLMGISLLFDSDFLQDFVMVLWNCAPIVFSLGFFVMLLLN